MAHVNRPPSMASRGPPRLSQPDAVGKEWCSHPAGEQFRQTFWHDLIQDPGPLAPLDESALPTLVQLPPATINKKAEASASDQPSHPFPQLRKFE
jgi:hypothetical protein